jgi:G3E family GTPase
MKKIPFHIISGFLGSGKTTFLKKIIENYSEKYKLGIIQNEFAPANIDGAVLKNLEKNFSLLEINNGSVFCVCLLGDFTRSLENFIDEHQPDILIIEASGLSDTTSVAEVLSSGKLGEKLFLASNWCIVDAPNFKKTGLMKQRVAQQIRMADIVIINKIDLVSGSLEQLENEINKLNPFVEIQKTTYCTVDFDPQKTAVPKFYIGKKEPMNRPAINSMVLKSGRKMREEKLHSFLDEWAPKSYRIKGFVNTKDGKTLAVHCTFESVEINNIENYFGPTELVALTSHFSIGEWNRSFREYAMN